MNSIWNVDELNILKLNYSQLGSPGCELLLPNKTRKQINSKASKIKLKVKTDVKNSNYKQIALEYYNTSQSKSNVSFDYFQNTTQEAAYILGFIFADGYLHLKTKNLLIENLKKDLDDIQFIFDKVGKWTSTERQRKDKQLQKRIQTNNKDLFKFLLEHNYLNRELGADKILKHIPENFHKDFIRGYFDGDGCFYFYPKESLRQCSFCSCYDQDWKFLQNILDGLNIKYSICRRVQKQNKHSVLRFTGKKNIKIFGDYIYNNTCGHLLRKYNKCLDMIN
jgi:intein/homing endonuclease